MEILIIKLSAIGDVIHTLPALDVLHHRFPKSNITWVIEEKASDIIKDHPYLKKVIVSKRKRWLKDIQKSSLRYPTLKEIINFIRELRSQKYDLVIDFQGLLKSAILVFLSRGKRKIGYSKTREMSTFFLNEKIPPYPLDQHAVERNINLVGYLGARLDNATFPIFIGEEDKKGVELLFLSHKLSTSKPLIAIHSQTGWITKRWNPLKMARLSDRFIEIYDAQIIFIGRKDDYSSIENILSLMNHSAVNAAGKTGLKELAYLLSLSNLMITVDSGPMHIASAMGTSTTALFGPTAPWKTGPYGNNAVIIRNQLPCSPCFKRECDSRACMEEISVEEVFQAVDRQLKLEYKKQIKK
jgi:3-deoxy-D-manno-octulosonic-acid transferase/heptosyltransferase-1